MLRFPSMCMCDVKKIGGLQALGEIYTYTVLDKSIRRLVRGAAGVHELKIST